MITKSETHYRSLSSLHSLHFHIGVILKLRKAFFGGGSLEFLTFSYGGGSQVASYVIFVYLILY